MCDVYYADRLVVEVIVGKSEVPQRMHGGRDVISMSMTVYFLNFKYILQMLAFRFQTTEIIEVYVNSQDVRQ